MESNVITRITRYNSDGVTPNKQKSVVPLQATVRRDGERALDTAEFVYSAETDVTIGDAITYIQDIANVSNLRFIQHFQEGGIDYKNSNKITIREESGFDVDQASANTTGRFSFADHGNITSFSANGDEYTALTADPQFIGTTSSILDFSGMFDIYIRCASNDTSLNNKWIMSKDDGTNGISVYMSNVASATIKVDLTVGGVISNITGAVVVNDGVYHWVRVYRDASNIVHLEIDGVADGTVTTSGNYNNVAQKLTFGNNNVSTRYFRGGKLASVRIYCGGNLSTSDNINLLASRRILQTMKFGGYVWKIEDITSGKKVYCKAFGQILTNAQVNPSVVTNLYTSKNANAIITDLITNYCSLGTSPYINIILFDNGVLTSHTYSNYIATGSLLNNIIYFASIANATWRITPRRILSIETNSFNNTDSPNVMLFKNTVHDITIDAHDDTTCTNDLEVVFGSVFTAHTSETFTSGVSQTVFTLAKNAYNLKVTDNGTEISLDTASSPAANTYTYDFYAKTVTFSTGRTSGHSIVVEYSYEDPTANNATFFRVNDGTSISQNGRHFKRITLQGVYTADVSEVNTFASNFITKYKNINQRVTIEASTLMNTIRENILVNVIDTIKKINTTNYTVLDINGNNLAGNSTPLVIRAIEWNYPQGTTDIHVGEYLFDAYDLDNVTTDQIIQNEKSAIQNKTT